MRVFVEHSTIYRYDQAVALEPHTFRLRPRMNSTQRLQGFSMQITPTPVGTTDYLDQDGNFALNAWFGGPTNELRVLSRFAVDLLQPNPFDYMVSNQGLQLPLWYAEPLCVALAPYRQEGHVAATVKDYARAVAAGVQHNTLAFLSSLNRQIFQTTHQVTRPEGAAWPSELTLRSREGSCRDLAVLFCDACRVMGFAARFVSGYECASAGRQDSYMHAWAEVYIPDAGWRAYDPSRGVVVANGHVAVAAAFDPNLASPITGLYFGGLGSKMEAFLQLHINSEPNPW